MAGLPAGRRARQALRLPGPRAVGSALGRAVQFGEAALDPYARAVAGEVRWDPAVYGHAPDDPDRADGNDSAPLVPRSVVVVADFDWGGDRRPGYATADSIFYEVPAEGFTKLHRDVTEEIRGTYAGD